MPTALLAFVVGGPALAIPASGLASQAIAAAHATSGGNQRRDDPVLKWIRDLTREGIESFKSGDYEAALAAWRKALDVASKSERYEKETLTLVLNMGEAYLKLYDIDGDEVRLVNARNFFQYYLERVRAKEQLSAKEQETVKKVRQRLDSIEAEFAVRAAAKKREQKDEEIELPHRRPRGRSGYRQLLADDPERKAGKAMMGVGGFMTGAGFFTFTVGTGVALAFEDLEAVIGTAVAGVALGIVGGAVLGVGIRKWRSARHRARVRSGIVVLPPVPSCTGGPRRGMACGVSAVVTF